MGTSSPQQRENVLQEHINRFEQYVERLLPSEHEAALSMLGEFRTAIEELQVAEEELTNQNAELITAREETENERRRYHELFDFAPDGYLVTNIYGIIIEANRAAQSLLKVQRAELIRKPLAVYIVLEDRRVYRSLLAASQTRSQTESLEVRIQPHEGKPFYAELTLSTFADVDGKPGIRWLLRDITERKQVELHLRQSEQHLSEAQHIAHVGSWHWDIESDVFTFSNEVYRIFGLLPQEGPLSYDRFLAYIHPGDREQVRELIRDAREQKYLFAADFRILRPDDSVRILYARGGFLSDNTGSMTSMIGSIEDVTDLRSVEEDIRRINTELERRVDARTIELKQANEELHIEVAQHRKTEQRLQDLLQRKIELYRIGGLIGMAKSSEEVLAALMDSSLLDRVYYASVLIFDTPWQDTQPGRISMPVFWDGVSGRVTEAGSKGYLDISSLRLDNLLERGRPIVVKDVANDERLDGQLRTLFQKANGDSAILIPLNASGEWFGELTLHFDAPELLSEENLEHIRGLVDRVAMAIYNLRLLASESLARREAEHANEMRLQLLAMISHELRTPLTSIKGFSTTLLAQDVTWEPKSQREFIEIIDSEADKLKELIDQLLDLSRLEAGLLSITPEKLSLPGILHSMHIALEERTKRHHLIVSIPPDLPNVRADARRIAQVIYNLVDNAVKYSSVDTDIVISAEVDADFVQVNVRDNGKGIPPEERQRVFEVFHRGANDVVSRVKGSGLGLAICKGLIRAHGGRIWIWDEQRAGTTISFTLPQAVD